MRFKQILGELTIIQKCPLLDWFWIYKLCSTYIVGSEAAQRLIRRLLCPRDVRQALLGLIKYNRIDDSTEQSDYTSVDVMP